ncbi:MAG TPA: flagellar biosynthesis protein FlhF [Spongiibacteraceae bacterium]|nr:flagellar biosynthesis protein FlhF [Spongiibacteraceae bacterium]
MKSFVATDMRTALRMVREALGDDAVILSNRRVAAGIELVAASEMPPEAPPSAAATRQPRTTAAERRYDDSGEVSSGANARNDSVFNNPGRQENRNGGWWQMQQELRSMRDLMEQQYSSFSWQQYRAQRPAHAAMWRRLQRLGLAPELVRQLLDESGIGDAADANATWQQLMACLTARIPLATEDLVAAGGVFAFVGPTGAGKTTTIAKLAARYVLEHGNSEVALITTDSYRIGAHEQLRTLSRILNIPCKIVGAQLDLATALYELRQCRLVLIDTAGFNMRAPELQQQLATLSALGDRVRCLQVLAVNSQQQVLRNAHRVYRPANLAGCIFTKLDEAASLGEALSLLVETGVPLAYVADGQAIPGDIAGAQAKTLVAKTIALAKQVECDEDQLAQAFALPRSAASA